MANYDIYSGRTEHASHSPSMHTPRQHGNVMFSPGKTGAGLSRSDIATALKGTPPQELEGAPRGSPGRHGSTHSFAGLNTSHASSRGGDTSYAPTRALSHGVAGDAGALSYAPGSSSVQRSHVEYYERELTRLQLELDRAMDRLNEERRLRLSQTLRGNEQSDELAAAERRERTLREDASTLRGASAASAAEAERLRDEVARLASANRELQERVTNAVRESDSVRHRQGETEGLAGTLRHQIAEQSAHILQLKSELKASQDEVHTLTRSISAAEATAADCKKRLESQSAELGEQRGTTSALQEQIEERDSAVSSLRRQIEEANFQAERAADAAQERERETAQARNALDAAKRAQGKSEQRASDAAKEVSSLKQEVSALTARLATLTSQLGAAESAAQEQEAAARAAQQAAGAHSGAVHELKRENDALQEQCARLTRQLGDMSTQARSASSLARDAASKGVQLEERHAVIKRKYGEMKRRAKDEASSRAAAEAAVVTLRRELERLSKLHSSVLNEVRTAGVSAVEAVQESSAATLRAMASEYAGRESELRDLLQDTQDALLHTRDVLVSTGNTVPAFSGTQRGATMLSETGRSTGGGVTGSSAHFEDSARSRRSQRQASQDVASPAQQRSTGRRFVSMDDASPLKGGHGSWAAQQLRADGSANVLDLPAGAGSQMGGGQHSTRGGAAAEEGPHGSDTASEARALLQRTQEAYLRLLQSPTRSP